MVSKNTLTERELRALGYKFNHVPLTRKEEYAFGERRQELRDMASELSLRRGNGYGSLANFRVSRIKGEIMELENWFAGENINLAIARSSLYHENNPSVEDLSEVISLSMGVLGRTVLRFDHTRGWKFSSYFTQAFNNEMYRVFDKHCKKVGWNNAVCMGEDGAVKSIVEVVQGDLDSEVEGGLAGEYVVDVVRDVLDEREAHVILNRFGLNEMGWPRKLKDIGEELGLCKQTLTKINRRALKKLRESGKFEDSLFIN